MKKYWFKPHDLHGKITLVSGVDFPTKTKIHRFEDFHHPFLTIGYLLLKMGCENLKKLIGNSNTIGI